MSDPKKPPAPKVHHKTVQPPSSGGGSAGDHKTNPEDLQNPLVADHLLGSLPDKMIEEEGQFRAAPDSSTPAPQVETKEQIIDRITQRINAAFKVIADTAAALGEGFDLALLQNAIDPEAVQMALPFNSPMIRAGGYALLNSVQKVPDAAAMKVDAVALGIKLAQAERIRVLRAVITPLDQILNANENLTLNDIAEIVDKALGQGWSTIQHNGALLRLLAAALAIRGAPAQDAQATRAANQRLEDATRADEQQKAQGQVGVPVQGTQITGTLTTQPPTIQPAGGTSATPAQPTHTSHGKKPAK